mgnify:CR=1 FL=1|jgi:hypothetical protein
MSNDSVEVKKRVAFQSMNANKSYWGNDDYKSTIVDIFYQAVRRVLSKPLVISEEFQEHIDNHSVKKEKDHCYPPSIIGRCIMDNADLVLNDFELFSQIFDLCSQSTCWVTQEENKILRQQTKVRNGDFYLTCSIKDKYLDAGINLISGQGPIDELPYAIPEFILEWEKQYIDRRSFKV